MAERINRFLGDTPLRTLLKLVAVSFVVGIIMSALHFTPFDLWYSLVNFVTWLYELGFEAIARIGIYFVYGAIVVVPVFILLRLMAVSGRRQ